MAVLIVAALLVLAGLYGLYFLLARRLDSIEAKLTNIHQFEEGEAMDLQVILDKVTAQKTVIDSNTTLLTELSALLRQHANDPAMVAAIAQALDDNTQAITDAVAANTPQADAPPADAPPTA